MKRVFYFILFLFVFACNEAPKEKPAVIDKTKERQVKKPTIDSFFESIVEESKIDYKQTLQVETSEKILKVAVILPVTGTYSKLGSEGLDVTVFTEGKLGQKLQIKVFNTESKKGSINFIAKKIKEEGFDVIIGPIFNFETVELASLNLGIPIISLSNDSSINANNVLIFGQNPEDGIKDVVTFFAQQEKKNFMAMFGNDVIGSKLYKTFKNSVNANKGEIMRVEFYDSTGSFEVSKFVNKITNGLVQKTYVSKTDKTIIPERKIRELQNADPTIKLEELYNITEKKVEVIYISASGSILNQIISTLNTAYNREKLKNVFIVLSDFEEPTGKGLQNYQNMLFYANNYFNLKAFMLEFKAKMGYTPSKFSSILYDAISYAVMVNNNSFSKPNFNSFQESTKGFIGVNGGLYFNKKTARRKGKIMAIKNGSIVEMETGNKENEKINKVIKNLDSNEFVNTEDENFETELLD